MESPFPSAKCLDLPVSKNKTVQLNHLMLDKMWSLSFSDPSWKSLRRRPCRAVDMAEDMFGQKVPLYRSVINGLAKAKAGSRTEKEARRFFEALEDVRELLEAFEKAYENGEEFSIEAESKVGRAQCQIRARGDFSFDPFSVFGKLECSYAGGQGNHAGKHQTCQSD